MQIKVLKFGGSSLADAPHFRQVAAIVNADKRRRFVVPSAPGKRSDKDTKVTDMLYHCYDLAAAKADFEKPFGQIIDRYEAIITELGLALDLTGEYQKIRETLLQNPNRDFAASRGEYLNGIILANFLGFDFIDAASVIFFKADGSFDAERTNEILRAELRRHDYAVIPGFYGALPDGTIKTFSRGGSDITGAIVARAAEADLYENWTDVSGFKMADPRIVKDPKSIGLITYRELRELSYMGATVLHEDSIFPVRFAGIPINIRNTNMPEDAGTMIVPAAGGTSENVITGIAGKPGFSIISIEKDMMNSELGFGRRVLEALERNKVSFEHLPSGIDTMCVIVHKTDLDGKRQEIIEDICRTVSPDTISIEDGLALIAIVGRGMVKAKGTAAKIFKAVAGAGINIRMIDQGSSELNVIIGVEEHDYQEAVRAIYREFVDK